MGSNLYSENFWTKCRRWCKCLCVTCGHSPGRVTRQCLQVLQVKQKQLPDCRWSWLKSSHFWKEWRLQPWILPQNPWMYWQPIFKLLCSCSWMCYSPYTLLPASRDVSVGNMPCVLEHPRRGSTLVQELYGAALQQTPGEEDVEEDLLLPCASWPWRSISLLGNMSFSLLQSQRVSVQACAFAPLQHTQCPCTSAGFSLCAVTGWGGERRGEQQPLIKTQPPWP